MDINFRTSRNLFYGLSVKSAAWIQQKLIVTFALQHHYLLNR